LGEPRALLLVPEEALGTDQGRKYVYVVGPDNKAVQRKVTVGKLYDGLRVIAEGVSEGERVVVDGLQRVRPGAPVTPVEADKETAQTSRQADKETRRQGDEETKPRARQEKGPGK